MPLLGGTVLGSDCEGVSGIVRLLQMGTDMKGRKRQNISDPSKYGVNFEFKILRLY